MSKRRSTIELRNYKLAGVTGFEPVFTISKTVALDQTKLYPNKLAILQGLEPRRTVLETVMLPLH